MAVLILMCIVSATTLWIELSREIPFSCGSNWDSHFLISWLWCHLYGMLLFFHASCIKARYLFWFLVNSGSGPAILLFFISFIVFSISLLVSGILFMYLSLCWTYILMFIGSSFVVFRRFRSGFSTFDLVSPCSYKFTCFRSN